MLNRRRLWARRFRTDALYLDGAVGDKVGDSMALGATVVSGHSTRPLTTFRDDGVRAGLRAFRSSIQPARLDPWLDVHGSTAFADGGSPTRALLERLDRLKPYSPERDAILAELLRIDRVDPASTAHSALLVGVHSSMLRVLRTLPSRVIDRAELESMLCVAFVAALRAYDPDRRSPHVQANVEMDARRALVRDWQRAQRTQRAEAEAAARIVGASEALASGIFQAADLMEPFETTPPLELDAEDVAWTRGWLESLVHQRRIIARAADLFLRVYVERVDVRVVAAEIGMSAQAARKAAQRARTELHALLTEQRRSAIRSPGRRDDPSAT